MRIESLHIDGFGHFNDFSIKQLPSNLTVFHGANEAGKSTLCTFVKKILFGFPAYKKSGNMYEPLKGGKHGGRLIVNLDSDERFIIERYANSNTAKLVFPDGSNGGQDELSKILDYTDKQIYENIYAFGLGELQDIHTLNNDDIKSLLYGARAGMGSVSIPAIRNEISKK